MTSIPPFYLPTTVFFVDDSTSFLDNLCLQLDPALAFQLYDSPIKALEVLNDETRQGAVVEDYFSRYLYTEDLPMTHHVLDLNVDKVHREVYNTERFEQVSVVVVDYDMPSIDGLEFCKRIRNKAIKKILLTGKADEKIAVQAFNQGLIDQFIMKQDKDVGTTLNQSIAEMQRAYFGEVERLLAGALDIGKLPFLRDPLFVNHFRQICANLEIVEFYVCSVPDSILMLDADGNSTLLLIPNNDERIGQQEIAEELGAPEELLEALRSDKYLPYFWKDGGHWREQCANWKPFLFPAYELKGKAWYLCAVVDNPPLFKTETVFSYNKFLEAFDSKRWG